MNCPVTCSKGWYSNGKVCAICPKNEYQDIAAQTSCQKCPAGKVTLGIGSTNSSQCINICTVPTIHFGEAYPPSGYEVFIFLSTREFFIFFLLLFSCIKVDGNVETIYYLQHFICRSKRGRKFQSHAISTTPFYTVNTRKSRVRIPFPNLSAQVSVHEICCKCLNTIF